MSTIEDLEAMEVIVCVVRNQDDVGQVMAGKKKMFSAVFIDRTQNSRITQSIWINYS